MRTPGRAGPGRRQRRLPPRSGARHRPAAVEIGLIGDRALELAAVPPGGRLLLAGLGSSAHRVLQLARQRGQEVYVLSRGSRHQQLARRLGAV